MSSVCGAGCNAISMKRGVCYPKKIEAGKNIPPNHDTLVDHMSLCPLHPGCGEWLDNHDQFGIGDIKGKAKTVAGRDACVELCRYTQRCNAVAYVGDSNSGRCYPKSIASGAGKSQPPLPRTNVHYHALCPMTQKCGTWAKERCHLWDDTVSSAVKVRLPGAPFPVGEADIM